MISEINAPNIRKLEKKIKQFLRPKSHCGVVGRLVIKERNLYTRACFCRVHIQVNVGLHEFINPKCQNSAFFKTKAPWIAIYSNKALVDTQ